MQIHPSCPTCIMLGPRGRRWRSTSVLAKVHPRPPCGATPTCVGVGETDARRPLRERTLRPRLPRRVLAPRVGRIAAVVVVPKEAAPLAAAASASRRSAARAARVRCRRRQTAAQQRRWRARWRGGRAAPPCEHSERQKTRCRFAYANNVSKGADIAASRVMLARQPRSLTF